MEPTTLNCSFSHSAELPVWCDGSPTPHIYPHPTGCPDLGPHPSQGPCRDIHSLPISGLQGVGHSSRGDGPGKGGRGELSAVSQDHGSGECGLGTQHTSTAARWGVGKPLSGVPTCKGSSWCLLAVDFSGLNEVTVHQAEFASSQVTVEIIRFDAEESPGAVDSFCR